MDYSKIVEVLHRAVLQKLSNDGIIPAELTRQQFDASVECVHTIVYESMGNLSPEADKRVVQREATLRAIQEVPLAIRNASVTPKAEETSGGAPEESTEPSDFQALVEQELQRRTNQDIQLGAKPPPPPPTPTSTTTSFTEPISSPNPTTTSFLESTPTPAPAPAPAPYPEPSPLPTPASSFRSTIVSELTPGSTEMRWEYSIPDKQEITGITRVILPSSVPNSRKYPFLLLKIAGTTTTDTPFETQYPLFHAEYLRSTHNLYKVLGGEHAFHGITGTIRIQITDPTGEIISTKFTPGFIQRHLKHCIKGILDEETGAVTPFNTPDITEKDKEPELLVVFNDYSISVCFTTNSF